jgi:MFS family permease
LDRPTADGLGEAGRRWAAQLALLAFAMLIVSLDQYIVVVALPEIGRELGYSAQTLQSVISSYAVASAGFVVAAGIAAIALVALNLHPSATTSAEAPCPRQLAAPAPASSGTGQAR